METQTQTVLNLKEEISNFSERDIRRVVAVGRDERAVKALHDVLQKNKYAYTTAEWIIQSTAETVVKKALENDWNLAIVFQFIHIVEDILLAIYGRKDVDLVRRWGGDLFMHVIRPYSSGYGPIISYNTISTPQE